MGILYSFLQSLPIDQIASNSYQCSCFASRMYFKGIYCLLKWLTAITIAHFGLPLKRIFETRKMFLNSDRQVCGKNYEVSIQDSALSRQCMKKIN